MQRTTARKTVLRGQHREQVIRIVEALPEQNDRSAAITLLARATGMRLREAILADLPRLRREAERLGSINMGDGAKGGREGATALRWIRVDEHMRGR
ncbi:hypothetical protein PS3A_39890 [Pseudomonas sp. 3A(2025)]